jgi:probable rRNA maturation factor
MRITVEYTAETKTPFQKDFFQKVAERTLAECRFSFFQDKEITLNVIAISAKKIQSLNEEYRSREAVTDVLSFAEYTDRAALEQESSEEIFLGEIFICPSFIEQAALEDKVTVAREMVYIFSHGVLHLVGFDHEEEMFAIQEAVTDVFTGEKIV